MKWKLKNIFLGNKNSVKEDNLDLSAGQFLIEILAAAAIVIVGVLAVFMLLTVSLGNTRVVSNYFIATYLASEGIEVVKNIIDGKVLKSGVEDWDNILADGNYELAYDSENLESIGSDEARFLKLNRNGDAFYSYNDGEVTPFKRRINISKSSTGDYIKVTSEVFWQNRGREFKVQLEDYFFRWK
jgi:hypothetical protein